MSNRFLCLLTTAFFVCSTPLLTVAQTAVKQQQVHSVQWGKPFQNVPDPRDVTLYQVNMRTFSKSGNFSGVTERLDSIKALGINVIYLMPHYPVGKVKSVNSPYCIQDYGAVNPEFGTLADLRALVDGAHRRNMSVILDWVANHTSFDHVWINNKDWYRQDSAGNIISPPGTGWNDVAQLDFTNAHMRKAQIATMKYWINAANVDGFRFDYSDGPPGDFWKEAVAELHRMPGRRLLLLAEGKRSENYTVGFDFNFGFEFFGTLKKIFEHQHAALSIDSMNVVDYVGATPAQRMVRYTTNHDVNGSDGTPQELFGGERGSMAAFVVAAYMKSIPMIYNGQEIGTPYRLTFPFTEKDIDWTINPQLKDEYKKLIHFRNGSNALRRGDLTSFSSADVCAFSKKYGSEQVVVLVNMRNKPVDYPLPSALQASTWVNAIGGNKVALAKTVALAPFSYLVLQQP